jgi:hypothetical protein
MTSTPTASPARCPCGDPVHGRWIVGGTWTCELYPCACQKTRDAAPEWSDGRCFWRVKSTGAWRSRCRCWGRRRDDRLPADCCANHPANPTYLYDLDGFLTHPDDEPTPSEPLSPLDPSGGTDEASWEPQYGPGAPAGPVLALPGGPGYDLAAARARAKAGECPCPTPWDGLKVGLGHHCVTCHTNWKNYSVSVVHRRDFRQPCRRPETIVDCQHGTPVLNARVVNGFTVWS